MIFTLIVILISLAILLDYSAKKRRYDITRNVPGPTIFPIFGSILIFKRRDMEGKS